MNPQYMMPATYNQGFGPAPVPQVKPVPLGGPPQSPNGPNPSIGMQPIYSNPQMKPNIPPQQHQFGGPLPGSQNGMLAMPKYSTAGPMPPHSGAQQGQYNPPQQGQYNPPQQGQYNPPQPGSQQGQYNPPQPGPPQGQYNPPHPGSQQGQYMQNQYSPGPRPQAPPPAASGPPPRPPTASTPNQLAGPMGQINLGGQQPVGPRPNAPQGPPTSGFMSMPPAEAGMNRPMPQSYPMSSSPMPQSQQNQSNSLPQMSGPGQGAYPPSGFAPGQIPHQPNSFSGQPSPAPGSAAVGCQYDMYSGEAQVQNTQFSQPPAQPQPQIQYGTAVNGAAPAYGSSGQGLNQGPATSGPYMASMQARYPQPNAPGPGMGMGPPPSSPTGPAPAMGRAPQMGAGGPTPMQPQQARRLDPEQMPSPIQVMEDDRKNRNGVFFTTQKGQVPPLVTTNFIAEDHGNCNPRFMRSTMYSVPATPDLMKQTAVPFAVVISPFTRLGEGEAQPPIVDMGEMGPVRCIRCKAYMSPFMQFMDGGRRFQCGFCKGTTEAPPEYFAHLDHTGQRVDKFDRPELCLGSYEFVATKDYCKNSMFPSPPAFVFVIDVSYSSIKNGMVHTLCLNMKSILSLLPREGNAEASKIKVGFITYNNTVHFYNIKGCLAQPQMMVVSDVSDMFMPLLDGFLVELGEAEAIIDSLMEQIPQMFADTRETETILGPAIQAGLEALKASDCCGKLYVFHSTLPVAEAPGKLRNRDDRKLLATDKEKTILAPQGTFYGQLGQDCVTAGCSVDLFSFPNAYIDIATIGQVCRLTGGQIYKYTYFQSDIDGPRFIEDLQRNIQRPIAFDAIMRVRTSTGVRPTDFYGSYYMSNTTDVELASVDSDKSITLEIRHDDKLTEEDAVYIQAAILYTSVGGQRRLRIHNLSLGTCMQMADLYRNCELDTIINFLGKASLRQLMEHNPKAVRESVINRGAQILACYRKNCASPSSSGQLILPECMKLFPLYANCLLKCDAIGGGSEMLTDDRSFMMLALGSMDVSSSLGYIYPRLLCLTDLDPADYDSSSPQHLPVALRCTIEKLRDNGAYLLENGIYMFMWIGMNVSADWLQHVFGVQSAAQIDIDKTKLIDLDSPISQQVRRIIRTVQQERQRCMRLTIVRQRDKLELVFRHFLVEDKGSDNSASYVDFLCHMHKEIRNLLS